MKLLESPVSGSLSRFPWKSLFVAGLLTLSVACQPRIGDDCRVNQDCSGERQRLCDTSQPGGYCTLSNCSATSCPDGEAICVMFNSSASSVPVCDNPGKLASSALAFCMMTCSEDKDCRAGYLCTDVAGDDPWGALVVQENPPSTKICIAPQIGVPIDRDHPAEVCDPGFSPGGASGS